MTTRPRLAVASLVLLTQGACDAALDQRLDLVTTPRILAITAAPAEARPGTPITLTALVVDADGPRADVPAWAACDAPTPPTEPNAVADGCFADQARPLGSAIVLMTTIPTDACLTYGPDTKPGGFRPRDPDPTGGFYQPIRVTVDTAAGPLVALGEPRVTCNLALAPTDLAQRYRAEYLANVAPEIAAVELAVDGAAVAPTALPADHDVTLAVTWPAAAAEAYLVYDPTTVALVTRREAMRVSWFTTAGRIAVDASAVAGDDPATAVTTTWHTPATPGPAWLWFVLRDDRGGVATAAQAVTIR
jgi:hypothetical protein